MNTWSELTKRERTFLTIWCAALIIPGLLAFVLMTGHQRKKRDDARERDRARMSEHSVIAGRTEPERTPPPGHEHDVATIVRVGMYVDHISEVEVVHSVWKMSFFIWFRWEGDLTPGESFKIVNGEINTRTLLEKKDEGKTHYALYSVKADITKNFNLARFPRDEHLLTISIEDSAKQSYAVKFEADSNGTGVSSRVAVPGYVITNTTTVVKPHSYMSAMGAPWLPENYKATYSQFTTGMSVERPSWGIFGKMFVGVYLAIAMGLAGLFIRGGGERVSLISTALFVAIVNALTIVSLVPDTGIATLADLVSNTGYVIIAVLILQAVIYQRAFPDPEAPAARMFDRTTLVIVTLFTILINLGIVLPL